MITAWSTAFLALASAFALISVWQNRKMRRSEYRAYVLVYAEADVASSLTHLVIHNVGRTHATDVQVQFDPPLEGPDPNLGGLAIWKGIPLLPPGHAEAVFWGTGVELAGEGSNYTLEYRVEISYHSPAVQRRRIEERTTVDANMFLDLSRMSPNPYKGIEVGLAEVRTGLARIESLLKTRCCVPAVTPRASSLLCITVD